MNHTIECDSIEKSFDKQMFLCYNAFIRRRETAYKRKGKPMREDRRGRLPKTRIRITNMSSADALIDSIIEPLIVKSVNASRRRAQTTLSGMAEGVLDDTIGILTDAGFKVSCGKVYRDKKRQRDNATITISW